MTNTSSARKGSHVELVRSKDLAALVPTDVPEEITGEDERIFREIISIELDDVQRERILDPPRTYPKERTVLATHWHPEFVPMDLIAARLDKVFPNRERELIIPTQHNQLMSFGEYTGVEVDCYSAGFNQKVQLLLHFKTSRMGGAETLRAMLSHTFTYRSSQLFDFIHTITKPNEDRLQRAAAETGASAEKVRFVQIYVKKIEKLLEKNFGEIPEISIKNKLLRNFFDALRPKYGHTLIDRVQIYLKAVKETVKEGFSLKYFYRTSEIIEEARALGAGVVIPHPEQFWPILLADYDVDGYEVWNPQSRRYTEFLIDVVTAKNKKLGDRDRSILVFMGDDCHLGEKVKDPSEQDKAKVAREVGVQPAWHDLAIRKKLLLAGMNRIKVIEEYMSRLDG